MRTMGVVRDSWGTGALGTRTGTQGGSVFGKRLAAAFVLVAMLCMLVPTVASAAVIWSNSGTLVVGSETDSFYVNVTPGVTYRVWTQKGTLPDPMLEVHDGGNNYYDDDSAGTLNAQITFTAATSQVTVVVTSYRQVGTGSYSVYMETVNSAPVASGGSFSVNEDGSYSGNLSGSDPDNNPIVYHLSSGASHGTASILGNGPAFTYVPTGNYNGSDSFSFYVSDGSANSAPAAMNVTINAVADPPVAAADSYTMDEDGMIIVNTRAAGVLNNDYDVDGGAVTASLVSGPAHAAQFWLNENGTFGYQPSLNWNGTDSFTYRPIEGGQYGDTVTVTLNVTAVNDAPVTVADSVSVTEDEFVSVAAPGVRANDPADIEGSALTSFVQTGPSHGAVVMQLDGSYVYTPAADFFGTDTFTYRNFDGTAFGPAATVTVTVVGTPDAPVSSADSYSVNEDGTLSVSSAGPRGLGVLANDVDVDLEPLTALLVTDVEHGTLSLNADGSFVYVPDANWYGTDTFEYNPYDGDLHGITVAVTISVNSVNDAPVADSDSYTTDEDASLTVDAAAGVLANDADPVEHSSLTAHLVGTVSHGSLDLNADGSFTYTPAANYNGSDSFTYRASDGTDYSGVVTVSLTVDSVNDAPLAVEDSYTTAEDAALHVDGESSVLMNDSDIERSPLTADLVSDVTHGTLDLSSNGDFTYVPDENYNGSDSFTYRTYDGEAYSSTVTVSLTITSVNDKPTADSDSYTTDEDTSLVVDAASGVLANDADPVEHSPLTASIVANVSHGTLSLSADGSFTYTPTANYHGPDSFTYRAYDGTDYSDTVSVTLTVSSVNDLPVATGDSYTTAEDTQLDVAAAGVLANDSDPVEDSSLTAVRVTDASHGHVTLYTTGQFVYVPEENYHGSDSFTYRVYDGTDYSNTVTVSLTVTSVYDPPVAVEDEYTTDEDETLYISAPGLLDNDLGDGPLSILSWQDSAQGTAGTVTCWGDGRLKYVPAHGFHGVDTFVYRITDGVNRSQYVTVAVNVTHVNHAPVAYDDWAGTAEDQTLYAMGESGVLANDYDYDEDALSALLVSDVSHGELNLQANGEYTYTPDEDFNGTDSFTYVANDGQYDSTRTATVAITVYAVNDAPRVQDHSYTVDEDGTCVCEVPGVLDGAYDVEGDPFVAELVSGPSHGSLELNGDGSFTYIPDHDFNGSDSFTFRGNDFAGPEPLRRFLAPEADGTIGTVTIDVVPVNDDPSFTSGRDVIVDEDSGAYAASWASEISAGPADESAQSLSFACEVSNSSLFSEQPAISANGVLSFIPAADANGSATVSVTLSDDGAPVGAVTGEFVITVNPVNDAPVAVGDSGEVDEDTLLLVSVESGLLANDTDIDSTGLSAVLVDGPQHGEITLNLDGSYAYSPDTNWNGEDGFTYRAFDGTDLSEPVSVSITVNPVNDAPTAEADSAVIDEDTLLVAEGKRSVLDNDGDVEEAPLTAILVSGASHGDLDLSSDGAYTYMPDADFNGSDSFTYVANDGELDSNIVTVEITVNPVNDAPVASDDEATTDEDTSYAGAVLANDMDVEKSDLTAVLVQDVAHGKLALAENGEYTYTPDTDYYGSDSFTYTAADGELDSNTAVVMIQVDPVNDAPSFAAGADVTVDEDSGAFESTWASEIIAGPKNEGEQSVSFGVEVSNNALFSKQPAIAPDGTLTFTPAPSANGSATCDVTLTDNGDPQLSATATFVIHVSAVNDAPVAHDDAATVEEDSSVAKDAAHGVLSNDTDIEGDSLTAALVDGPDHGTLTFDADGSYTYAPDADWNGTDSFTYKVTDGKLDSAPATVRISVTAVNDAPVAAGNSYSTDEDQQLAVATPGVLGNDDDVDGDTLSAVLVEGTAHGELVLSRGGSFTYTPEHDWSGTDTFTYRASDDGLSSSDVTVSIAVTAVNDAPSVDADDAHAVSGKKLTVDAAHGVLANDGDTESDGLTAQRVTDASHGVLALQADGGFEYTADAAYSGPDSFTYRAYDGSTYSAPVLVSITVSPAEPGDVTFGIISTTKTKLSWTSSPAALSYVVYRSGSPVVTLGSTETSYTFAGFFGPGADIEVQALGANGTHSVAVQAAYGERVSVKVDTITFAGGVATLTSTEKANLRALATKIAAQGFKTVTVNGYTRRVQTRAYRAKLSLARANAVKSYLASRFKVLGVSVTIKAYGRGAANPVGGDGLSLKNHRAEVVLR